MSVRRASLAALVAFVLAACAGTRLAPPSGNPTALPGGVTPAELVAAIRAAGTAADDELAVQPLRANEVEDHRRRAAALEAEGRYRDAAAALDAALATHDADPTVLQERAEVAILLQDFAGATAFARRAIERGTDVGPLCRRHWATIEHAARATAQAQADIEHAKRQREACTVAPPARY